MCTSKDRAGLGFQQAGLGFQHSSIPCCFSSPTRSYSVYRSRSPSVCRTTCSYLCDCHVPAPRKTVRFDHRLGRSRSVNRGRHGSYTDRSSIYCSTSPALLSRSTDDTKTMEYANLNVLLRRLSILQLEMKGLLNGRSLKNRVQMIGQNLDGDANVQNLNQTPSKNDFLPESKPLLKCAHHLQSCANAKQYVHHAPCTRHAPTYSADTYRWKMPSFHQKETDPASICRKHDTSPSQAQQIEEQLQHSAEESTDKAAPCDAPQIDSDWTDKKEMVQLWRDYNCDLHLRRIIDGSRKEAAYRILEKVVHSRLTYYMLQYIGAVAKGLMGDEKTHYLSFFKREGPFKSKPLNEGTYCELLGFVDKQVNLARDVIKALEVSEEGLEEEGGRGGYDPGAIGDIRAQMRVFLSLVSSSSSPSLSNGGPISQAEEDNTLFTKEFLHDLMKAADQGKLGALQPAHRLIKLACFLALKRVESTS